MAINMARQDTAWFRVIIGLLLFVLCFVLPLSWFVTKYAVDKINKQDAIIDRQNKKISQLEKKLLKDDDD